MSTNYDANIYSIYMQNIAPEVVEHQRIVVEKFLPDNCYFEQYLYTPKDPADQDQVFISAHDFGMAECFQKSTNTYTIFLDIDCVPLSANSFQYLIDQASDGSLVGGAHFASHIVNGNHIYASPACMAFMNSAYLEVGSPPFHKSYRGDCAEELTYWWEAKDRQVKLMWPSDIQKQMWVCPKLALGLGVTYEDKFYHAFMSRQGDANQLFINKCEEVLAA